MFFLALRSGDGSTPRAGGGEREREREVQREKKETEREEERREKREAERVWEGAPRAAVGC